MSSLDTLQTPHSLRIANAVAGKRPWWRSLVLIMFLLLSIVLYILLMRVASPDDHSLDSSFLQTWLLCFLPYLAACVFVLVTKPAVGRWRWIELAVIFVGAFIFRALLLPVPPGLSHDSWRYLWDARVILHGYSPYIYPPSDHIFHALQDPLIFGNSRFRTAPTLYPPGAQFFYMISYLLAPSNLFFLKGMFVAFDMVTCGALVVLLKRNGLDPRRVIIYAWCPLPIIEFAIEGHVDALTLMFMVLSLLCATSNRRGARLLTGLLIGVATLTKIYPILLLAVVLRRGFRDWALVATCLATIFLGYLPFLILGHGQVLGFFAAYASEEGGNAGVFHLFLYWLGGRLGMTLPAIILLQHIVTVLLLGGVSLCVWILRLHERISVGVATLLLVAVALAISNHVFPWYASALLPWITLSLGPLWTRRGPSGKGLAVLALWYFTCTCLLSYYIAFSVDWHSYYAGVYDVLMIGLSVALLIGVVQWLRKRRSPLSSGLSG